jgi:hypothetical protein
VEYVRHKFTRACEIEQDNLKQNQAKMKQWYDNDAIIRKFKSGEKFFSKKYKLTVDASDAGVGAILLQERKDDIDLPNCYFC